MIDLPEDLVDGLRQRLGINDAHGDVVVPVDDMVQALGDRLSLSDLLLVIEAGDWTDEIVLTSNGRLQWLLIEDRIAA